MLHTALCKRVGIEPAYIPEAQLTADVEHMALYAGQSCELVHDIKPARQIVQDLVREAGEAMARLAADGAAQKGPSGAS
jgi:NAD(P)H-dependent flavin oxidoreductase YrpB (nitropropane dioxygenase family)